MNADVQQDLNWDDLKWKEVLILSDNVWDLEGQKSFYGPYLFAVDVDHAGVAFRGAVEFADALDPESFDELKMNLIYVYWYYWFLSKNVLVIQNVGPDTWSQIGGLNPFPIMISTLCSFSSGVSGADKRYRQISPMYWAPLQL